MISDASNTSSALENSLFNDAREFGQLMLDEDSHDISNTNLESKELLELNELCSICEDEKNIIKFSCGKGCCRECFDMHLETLLEKYKLKVYSTKIIFICCGKCKCEQSTEFIESLMEKNTRTLYHEVLLKMYLVKSSDLLSCPNSKCSNYNFLEEKNSKISNFLCKMTQCSKCSECGAEYSRNTLNYLNPKIILNFFSLNDLKSKFLKFITTKYCNNCNTPIEKAEGCKHIECNLCGYSFCWRCTCDWNEHNELCCMGLLTNIYDEALRPDYIHFFLSFLLVLTILKLIFSFNILLFILSFLIKVILIIAMLIFDVFIIINCVRIYVASTKKVFSLLLPYFGYTICFYYFRLHPFSEKTYFYSQIFLSICSFLVIKFKKRILRR